MKKYIGFSQNFEKLENIVVGDEEMPSKKF